MAGWEVLNPCLTLGLGIVKIPVAQGFWVALLPLFWVFICPDSAFAEVVLFSPMKTRLIQALASQPWMKPNILPKVSVNSWKLLLPQSILAQSSCFEGLRKLPPVLPLRVFSSLGSVLPRSAACFFG